MKIKLTQGKEAEIDDEDYHLIKDLKFCAVNTHGKWYAATRIKQFDRKVVTLHRLIMNTIETNDLVDHIDSNGLNCKRNNLRIATRKINSINRKPKKNGTSIYLGVCYAKQKQRNKEYYYWQANITVDSKTIHLGNFKTEIEAAKAYDKAALKYHKEFANVNFKNL